MHLCRITALRINPTARRSGRTVVSAVQFYAKEFDLTLGQRQEQAIVVYSTTWCGDCRRAKRVLDQHDARYKWIDIETQPEALDRMMQLNGGLQSVPTILFPDGTVVVEPSNQELADLLQSQAA